MKRRILYVLALTLFYNAVFAQTTGNINGVVKNKNTQEVLQGVTIIAEGTDTISAVSDAKGFFSINTSIGNYALRATSVNYDALYLYNIAVSSGNATIIELELQESSKLLEGVTVKTGKSVMATNMITPLSTQRLTSEEIKVNPGGNFDLSKVIQVLPGVGGGTTPSRNDIIVRGGGPAENVYYLDGIEIPVLNHFQTQGASGGATGIINVSFVDDIQLTSSAFDSKYDNALASTFVIKQRNGNSQKTGGNLRLSGSEFAATLEGPAGPKTTYLASARRSYLKYLFTLLDLPIRPDYWDFQYKVNHKINPKTELNFIGIGAIDRFKLEAPSNSDANTEYTLRANPLINQWNYTVGASLKRLVDNGFYTLALSRNMFSNGLRRYENNATESGALLYDLNSREAENKLRLDVNKFRNGWKYSYGVGGQYVKYDADLFNTVATGSGNLSQPATTITTQTAIDFFKLGAYGHVSKRIFEDRLLLSAGVRLDVNSFTTTGMNPLKTLSPRLSLAYTLSDNWNVSASVGSYYKIPVYTSLGYRDASGTFVNKDLAYIQSIHYTAGIQFLPRNDFRFTLEGFYKDYNNYPVSATTGISIANIGTDFSAIGNDVYRSSGNGKVYGVEAYAQQKLVNNIFYVVSATLYRSEFSGTDNRFIRSTWDLGYIVASTLGYKFKRNWDIGVKYRIAGGQPYTPFDLQASQTAYLTTGRGTLDYSQLNAERLPFFQQLDLRIDKRYYFKKTSLDIFIDFQNILLYKTPGLPNYTFERNADNTGFATTDGQPVTPNGSNAIPVILNDRSANIVPAIGFIFEF